MGFDHPPGPVHQRGPLTASATAHVVGWARPAPGAAFSGSSRGTGRRWQGEEHQAEAPRPPRAALRDSMRVDRTICPTWPAGHEQEPAVSDSLLAKASTRRRRGQRGRQSAAPGSARVARPSPTHPGRKLVAGARARRSGGLIHGPCAAAGLATASHRPPGLPRTVGPAPLRVRIAPDNVERLGADRAIAEDHDVASCPPPLSAGTARRLVITCAGQRPRRQNNTLADDQLWPPAPTMVAEAPPASSPLTPQRERASRACRSQQAASTTDTWRRRGLSSTTISRRQGEGPELAKRELRLLVAGARLATPGAPSTRLGDGGVS